jgi:hypothetical protein
MKNRLETGEDPEYINAALELRFQHVLKMKFANVLKSF